MYQIFWTKTAKQNLEKMYLFLLEKNSKLAQTALQKIKRGINLLEEFPFSCRKVTNDATLRELIIPFGSKGYVLLFRIKNTKIIILAIRHQNEYDYH